MLHWLFSYFAHFAHNTQFKRNRKPESATAKNKTAKNTTIAEIILPEVTGTAIARTVVMTVPMLPKITAFANLHTHLISVLQLK